MPWRSSSAIACNVPTADADHEHSMTTPPNAPPPRNLEVKPPMTVGAPAAAAAPVAETEHIAIRAHGLDSWYGSVQAL